jgi:hypothetical protein
MQVNGYYNNTGMGVTPASTPGYPAPVVVPVNNAAPLDADSYLKVVAAITPLTAGVAPAFSVARHVRDAKVMMMRTRGRAMSARSLKMSPQATGLGGQLMGGMWSALKTALLFKGLSSLVLNGLKVYRQQETLADGGANVAGDLVSAAVGGTAAGLASGLATVMLAGVLGTGFVMMLTSTIVGAAAFFVVDQLLRDTAIYNNLKATVHTALAGAG